MKNWKDNYPHTISQQTEDILTFFEHIAYRWQLQMHILVCIWKSFLDV